MNINRVVLRGHNAFSHFMLLVTTKPTVTIQQDRAASTFIRFRTWYRSKFAPKAFRPPYNHVCQIGDPVLRQAAARVPPEQITSKDTQKIIATIQKVMKQYNTVSLSAPQIGIPLQIFVMEMSKEALNVYNEELKGIFKLSEIPHKVVINPVVKVTDYTQQTNMEMCLSVRGFVAEVNRYSTLKITAWDEKAERKEWEASGYEARVIQHEMDHLAGLLFTDRMDCRSLTCSAWEAVNQHQGNVYIPYWPKKKRRGMFSDSAT